MALKQESPFEAITARDRESTGTLFGAEDLQHRTERSYSNDRLSRLVRSRNGQLHILALQERRRYELKLKRRHLRQLLVYTAEDVIVKIPSVIEIGNLKLSARSESCAPYQIVGISGTNLMLFRALFRNIDGMTFHEESSVWFCVKSHPTLSNIPG